MLYFGSYNPIHRGHIALAEYVLEKGLCEQVILMVSPQNPLKDRSDLAPDLDRLEMVEIACAESKFPQNIVPSAIEFVLDKPSYTIDTLRYLKENHSSNMDFSILMGSDLLLQLPQWKEYKAILENFPIFVYPRDGYEPNELFERATFLEDAPLCHYSSTNVRQALVNGEPVDEMVCKGVADYIKSKALWSPTEYIERLDMKIKDNPESVELYIERGKWYHHRAQWGNALNDFNKAIKIDPSLDEIKQYVEMIQEILAYRHIDIYNP